MSNGPTVRRYISVFDKASDRFITDVNLSNDEFEKIRALLGYNDLQLSFRELVEHEKLDQLAGGPIYGNPKKEYYVKDLDLSGWVDLAKKSQNR
jgi:hypothetical protein